MSRSLDPAVAPSGALGVDTTEPEWWSGALEAMGGSVFHSSVWARHVEHGQPQAHPHFFRYVMAGEDAPAALALGFVSRSPRWWAAPLSGQVFLDSMPVARGGEQGTVVSMLRLIERYARGAGAVELEVGSYAAGGYGDVVTAMGCRAVQRLEFVFPLGEPEAALWGRLPAARRRNIRKAQRAVAIRELDRGAGVAALRALHAATETRVRARGGEMSALPSDESLAVLLDARCARIYGAMIGGSCVSAALFTAYNGLVYYNLGGNSEAGLQAQAPSLLFWEALLQYRQEGFTVFNLGGCGGDALSEDSPEHGVYVYKQGFGADVIECVGGRKILRPVKHSLRRLLRRGSE